MVGSWSMPSTFESFGSGLDAEGGRARRAAAAPAAAARAGSTVDLHAIDAILLDGVAMPVPRRSTEPGRPRHRREMT